MFMLAAVLVETLSVALSSTSGLVSDSNQGTRYLSRAFYTWELVPMIVAAPDETLFFMTTTPIPAYHEITSESGVVRRPLWHALGGRITFMNEEWVVYRAPDMEGVYLVYWESADRSRRFGFFVSVQQNQRGDQILPWSEFAGYRGAFVPLANGVEAPTAIFLARRRASTMPNRQAPPDFVDSNRNVRVRPPNKPLLPRPNRFGTGSHHINESVQAEDTWRREVAGELHINSALADKLARRDIDIGALVGQKIYVHAEWRRVTRFRRIDCYHRKNSQWRWIGSRVEYEVCTYLIRYYLPWICQAVEAGILEHYLCPQRPLYQKHCISIGDYKCPHPTRILTDRHYDPCREMTGE